MRFSQNRKINCSLLRKLNLELSLLYEFCRSWLVSNSDSTIKAGSMYPGIQYLFCFSAVNFSITVNEAEKWAYLILSSANPENISGTYKWAHYDDESKATISSSGYEWGVMDAFDGKSYTYWFNFYSSDYLEVTFQFTGILCKINIQKAKYGKDSEYGTG